MDGVWRAADWLSSLGTHDLLSDALLQSLEASGAAELELPFLRALGRTGSVELVVELLRASPLIERLGAALWDGLRQLNAARAASGQELHDKFCQDGGAFTLSYGELSSFFEGLAGLVGEPSPTISEAMAREHCDAADSDNIFHAGNYETDTTSHAEWWFVADPEGDHSVRLGVGASPTPLGMGTWPLVRHLIRIYIHMCMHSTSMHMRMHMRPCVHSMYPHGTHAALIAHARTWLT